MSFFSHLDWYEHNIDEATWIIAEARAKNIVKQAEGLFMNALKKSGMSMEFLSGPHTEIYKFVGQIILDNPELAKYFPDVKKPYQLKSRHIARLATIEGGDKSVDQLQSEINDTFSDIEKFKKVAQSLHAIRRAKGLSEVEGNGVIDKREKVKQWAKKLEGDSKPEKVSASDLSPEEQERVGAAVEKIRPSGELANVMRALRGVRFPTESEKRMGEPGPTLEDLAADYPEIEEFMNATDLDGAIEALVASEEPIARQVLNKIYEVLPESVKRTPQQLNQLMQEKFIKSRQHRFMIEERYRF